MLQRILIADDHPLFRAALLQAIRRISEEIEVSEVSSLAETSDLLAAKGNIDLLLLDIHMSDSDGFAGLIMFKQAYPNMPIVIVSASEDRDNIQNAMNFGASGYIPKSSDIKIIREAIDQIIKGDRWWPQGSTQGLSLGEKAENMDENARKFATLTPTQSKVFMAIAEGLLNKQIAYKMDISESTIKTHITAIFKKLGISSRTQAVIFAKELEKHNEQF